MTSAPRTVWRLYFGASPQCSSEEHADAHAASFSASEGRWGVAQFQDFAKDPCVYWVEAIASDAGNQPRLLGIALIRVVLDESELLTLCRRPNWSGQSLGEDLLNRALTNATEIGAKTMFLEVAETNQSARSLYEKLGFEEVAIRPRYYRRGKGVFEDALVLRTDLSHIE